MRVAEKHWGQSPSDAGMHPTPADTQRNLAIHKAHTLC